MYNATYNTPNMYIRMFDFSGCSYCGSVLIKKQEIYLVSAVANIPP